MNSTVSHKGKHAEILDHKVVQCFKAVAQVVQANYCLERTFRINEKLSRLLPEGLREDI